MTLAQARQPLVFIVSGPSGSGKSTLVQRMLEVPGTMVSVSSTTRPPPEHGKRWKMVADFAVPKKNSIAGFAPVNFSNMRAFSESINTARRATGSRRRNAEGWIWSSKLTCRAPNR